MLKILKPIFVMAIFAVSGYSQANDLLLRENVHVVAVNCNLTTIQFQEGSSTVLQLAMKSQNEGGSESYQSFCEELKSLENSDESIQLLVRSLGWENKGKILIQQVIGFIDQSGTQTHSLVSLKDHKEFKKTICGKVTKSTATCLLESPRSSNYYYIRTETPLAVNYIPAKKKTSASRVESYLMATRVTLNIDKSGSDSENREYHAVLSNYYGNVAVPFSMH